MCAPTINDTPSAIVRTLAIEVPRKRARRAPFNSTDAYRDSNARTGKLGHCVIQIRTKSSELGQYRQDVSQTRRRAGQCSRSKAIVMRTRSVSSPTEIGTGAAGRGAARTAIIGKAGAFSDSSVIQ
jgi:hypothetical protein